MISNPKMTVYAASKWAVIGWSDSLRIELDEMKKNVHVTTIAPYYINTGMFNGVESPIFPILDPEKTAGKIIRVIERNQDFCGLPWGFHLCRASCQQNCLILCLVRFLVSSKQWIILQDENRPLSIYKFTHLQIYKFPPHEY